MGRRYQLNCSFSDGSTKSAGSFEIPDGEPALVYGAIVPQIPTPVVSNIALPVSGFNRTPVIGDVVNIVCGANGRSGIAIGKVTAVDSTNATCNITSFVETTGPQGENGEVVALYIHHINYMKDRTIYLFSIFSNSRADKVTSFAELVSIMEEGANIVCSSGDSTVVAVKRSGSDLLVLKNDLSQSAPISYWKINNGTVTVDTVQTIN